MMRTSKMIVLFFSVLLLCTSGTISQSEEIFSDEVVKATKSGNAQVLSVHFFNNIELVLPGKTGVFSKKQAEMIVKDFFGKNPPVDFRIIHEGRKENASYAIGNYSASTGNYRFTFLTKNTASKVLIHQLRIEKQDE